MPAVHVYVGSARIVVGIYVQCFCFERKIELAPRRRKHLTLPLLKRATGDRHCFSDLKLSAPLAHNFLKTETETFGTYVLPFADATCARANAEQG